MHSVEDVRDDLDFETEVVPHFLPQLQAPDAGAKLEFIRRVAGIPQGPEWPFDILFFTTEGRAELERRAGGSVVQNVDHTYSLTLADYATLVHSAPTPPRSTGGWRRSTQTGSHRLPTHGTTSSDTPTTRLGSRSPSSPYTQVDALVPPAHISKWRETVAAAGSADLVAEAWTSGVGHCNFTPQQMLVAVAAMETWIESGVAPTGFPASDGFIEFDPPPWPQP